MKRCLSVFLTVMILFALPGCGKKTAPEADPATWQEQYDLGIRYLSEGNYEEAIIAFTAAIEIDPKRADAYVSLADVYVELGDTESAIATLESGYAQTQSAELQNYLDSLKGPGEEEGVNGATAFESRKWYQEYDELTTEQQAFLAEMISALKAGDSAALAAMAIEFVPLFERQGPASTFSHLITRTEEYKVLAKITQNAPDNKWFIFEIRPQTGMGYFAQLQPESWVGANQANWDVWDYASCECVDWQPEGDFIQESEDYFHNVEGRHHSVGTGSGTAAGGVMLTQVSTIVSENLTTGEVVEYTSEDTYENGNLDVSDGSTESFRTPFAPIGTTYTDLDMIFW